MATPKSSPKSSARPADTCASERDGAFHALKTRLLEGGFEARGAVLTEYQVGAMVLADDQCPRSAVVEALGRLQTLGLIERRPLLPRNRTSGRSPRVGWAVRELTLEEKSQLIRMVHSLVKTCIPEAVRRVEAAPAQAEPMRHALARLDAFLDGRPRKPTRDLIHAYHGFLEGVAAAAEWNLCSETLTTLCDRLSFARVVFPHDLQGIVADCHTVFDLVVNGDVAGADAALSKHFSYFTKWFADAISNLDRAVGGDRAAALELVGDAWPLVRRVMQERWVGLPCPPRLSSEDEWSELKQQVAERAADDFASFAREHNTGNISIWFLKLASYIIRDPAELLDLISIECAENERAVLHKLAGIPADTRAIPESTERTLRSRGKRAVEAHLARELGFRLGPERDSAGDPLGSFLAYFGWVSKTAR